MKKTKVTPKKMPRKKKEVVAEEPIQVPTEVVDTPAEEVVVPVSTNCPRCGNKGHEANDYCDAGQ